MNQQIINNLYQLWELVGTITNKLVKTEYYSAVSMGDSDWPNRIFKLSADDGLLNELICLSQEGKLPEIIALEKGHIKGDNPNLQFMMKQRNMALDLSIFSNDISVDAHIKPVESEADAINFAQTASNCFGYRIDPKVIYSIVQHADAIRLFIYNEDAVSLGCGMVFFDSDNIAGLHMIGTLPEGRGKGIGKSITERLIKEAKLNKAEKCVLHASAMGESIYKRLGFKPYDELETYRILRKD